MQHKLSNGFTLIELLVVLAIIALLMGILAPVLSRWRTEARGAVCASNLRQLATGFHLYANDHRGYLPTEENEVGWFVLLTPYLPADQIYRCPSDSDTVAIGAGISYAWRDSLSVTDLASSLAGRNLGKISEMDLILLFETIPGWHGDNDVQGATLDTSARRYRHDEFEANLARAVE